MPSLNKLWTESKGKGLHIFHIESQNHSREEIEDFCRQNGMEFSNFAGRAGFTSYQGDNGLPYAFVIGAEGKVVFQGRGNYKAVIREELAKVKYPGLGQHSVAKPLHKAATNFARKQYAKAISEAEKILDEQEEAESPDPAVSKDARYIVSRTHLMGKRLRARIEEAKKERMYPDALADLKLMSVQFKGMPVASEASDERKTLKKDPAVKAELKAFSALAALEKKLEKERDPHKKRETLLAFSKKFDGKKAADVAKDKAKAL